MLQVLKNILTINWSAFFTICMIALGLFTAIIAKLEKSYKMQLVGNSTIKMNGVTFTLVVIIIIYLTFVLANWYSFDWALGGKRIFLLRYLIGICIFAGISILFSIANYILYVIDTKAHVISNDILQYYTANQKTKSIDKEIVETNKRKMDFEAFLIKVENSTELNNVSDDIKNRIIEVHFRYEDCYSTSVFKFSDMDSYLIKAYSRPNVDYALPFWTHALLYENRFLYLGNDLKYGQSIDGIKHTVRDILKNLVDVELPALSEASKKLPIIIFIQSFLMEIFGLKQTYITPISFGARFIYLAFGIYKFLLLGTFISLLIK